MAEQTKIEWTDSTFNPWIGCQHVSDGCQNCYAETDMDKRYHRVVWGPHGERKRTTAGYWRGPLRWNATAASFATHKGHCQRVFCASLADWLDNQAPQQWREDLGELIETTPQLDWLLLTKRIENYRKLAPCKWLEAGGPPTNVWLGITAESQEYYDQRWPILARIPAVVRFVSYEPAIGPVTPVASFNANSQLIYPDWLICGGESGPHARKMDVDWARDVRNSCIENNISFFFKQWGTGKSNPNPECDSSENGKGGGLLDGRLWREFPIPRRAALLRL